MLGSRRGAGRWGIPANAKEPPQAAFFGAGITMGRLLVFLLIIGAALAGVWFYMPGGKDMLLGAKDKAMSYMPGKADEAPADTVDAAEEAAAAADEAADAAVDAVEEAVDAAEDAATEEAPQ